MDFSDFSRKIFECEHNLALDFKPKSNTITTINRITIINNAFYLVNFHLAHSSLNATKLKTCKIN